MDAAAIQAFPTIVVADSSLTADDHQAYWRAAKPFVLPTPLQEIQAQVMGVGVGFFAKTPY